MCAAAVAFALSAHAAEGPTPSGERPAAPKEKAQRAPSKEAHKPSAPKKKAPRKAAGSEQQKPAAKPCEEVKPCAIE